MYGTFPTAFCKAITPFIKGQRVIDLGCGDMGRTDVLRRLDPAVILAVDKELPQAQGLGPQKGDKVIPIQGYFKDLLPTVGVFAPTVAHVAWPPNDPLFGLMDILDLVPTVIYVGCNFDGSSCGSPALFKYFITRALTLYIPDPQNSLIVLGEKLPNHRAPTSEEDAALNMHSGNIRAFKS